MKPTALAAVAILALAGCSTAKGTTAVQAVTPLTMAQVATKAGCVDMKAGDLQAGTKEAATCTKDGHTLYLYTFADDAARDGWMKIAKGAGALGSFAQGTSWVAQTV